MYGGRPGFILVTFDEVTPGLTFNSQSSEFAKWVFEHNEEWHYHEKGSTIARKIDKVIAKVPALVECIVRDDAGDDKYAWFNVYSIPGWGERFRTNEQVRYGVRVLGRFKP